MDKKAYLIPSLKAAEINEEAPSQWMEMKFSTMMTMTVVVPIIPGTMPSANRTSGTKTKILCPFVP